MVRIRRSHRRGPGSIPGQGTDSFFLPFKEPYRNVFFISNQIAIRNARVVLQIIFFPNTLKCPDTPPQPVPSPDEKGVGLGMGPAPPPRKKSLATKTVTTITETLNLEEEGATPRRQMTPCGESRKFPEAIESISLLSTRIIKIGTWNVKTM